MSAEAPPKVTPRDFYFWLQGVLDATNGSLTDPLVASMKTKMALVSTAEGCGCNKAAPHTLQQRMGQIRPRS